MKNFNQMTERQMSKVDGGLFDLLFVVASLVVVVSIGGAAIGAATAPSK